jgi:hypothetical protein
MTVKYLSNYANIIVSTGLAVGLFFTIFAYIQTEWLTRLYLSQISNSRDLCTEVADGNLKYVKLVEFTKYRREAVMYCIYESPKDSLILYLAYNPETNWKVYSAKQMFVERQLIWPVYR